MPEPQPPRPPAVPHALACMTAALSLVVVMNAPPLTFASWLSERMLSVHLVLELFAIMIAVLVIVVSWHTFAPGKGQGASALMSGFVVVASCDLLHALSYAGMPEFITQASTPRAIFFWLMGRSAEVLTLAAIALGLAPRASRNALLAFGIAVAGVLVWLGNFHLEVLPQTFVAGKGVTAFKAGYEYTLCALNMGVAWLLLRAARLPGQERLGLMALSSFMMGIGELAFTSYVAPSDFQNIFGHVYKLVAYALLYRATFLQGIRAPFEALRESEARLRESEQRMRTVGANLPNCLIYRLVREPDGRHRFVHLSEALERTNGLQVADVLRDPLLLYGQVLPEDRPALHAAEQRSAARLELFDARARLRHSDGRVRHMHIVSMPRRLPDGRIVWDGTETDVTERELAIQQQRALEDQLREVQKMESIGTLASGIAHDFNNVLGSILGNTAMAQEDAARGAEKEVLYSLDQVRKAASRARNLVRQILAFSRHEPVRRSVQPLQPVVEEALELLRATLPAKLVLDGRLPAGPVLAAIDATQIEQVLMNLCTNAWQAIAADDGRVEVGVDVVDAENLPPLLARPPAAAMARYAHLWVKDNGCGMDEVTRLRAFEPFFTTKPAGSGTGLGLSVVSRIVQAHEGLIHVDSVPGRGTCFDIYLPLAADAAVTDLPGPPAAVAAVAHGERVLYLDDDEVMCIMVERLLRRAGYAVRSFREPAAALDALRAEPQAFDVVVTDFNMPHQTGLDVIAALALIRPRLPAVLSSGSVTEELRTQARQHGVLEVMEKQNSFEELAAAVGRALAAAGRR